MARIRSTDRSKIRNDRISLVLPSETCDGIRTLAMIQGASVNDVIVRLVAALVEKNSAVIEKFNAAQMTAASELDLSLDGNPDDEPA